MTIKNKIYVTKGLLLIKNKMYKDIPLNVIVTNDELGCTISIGSNIVDVQFTVPFDKILNDIEG